MPIGPARMPIMDHLGELRRRLTIIVVSVIVCALIVYFATPTLIELMIGQISDAMNGAARSRRRCAAQSSSSCPSSVASPSASRSPCSSR